MRRNDCGGPALGDSASRALAAASTCLGLEMITTEAGTTAAKATAFIQCG